MTQIPLTTPPLTVERPPSHLQAGQPFAVVVLGSSSITAEAFYFWPSLPLVGLYRQPGDEAPLTSPLQLKQSCRFISQPNQSVRLDPVSLHRAFDILLPYIQAASASGVQRFFGVATEAFRRADPAMVDSFLQSIYHRSHEKLAITVISGAEEAELAAAAASWQLGESAAGGLVLDFGSASLDLAWMQRGKVLAADSLPLGPLCNDHAGRAVQELLISRLGRQLNGQPLILRGGLMTRTGLMALREAHYPLDRIDGFAVSTSALLPILARWMHQDFTKSRELAVRFNLAAGQQPYFAYALQVLHGLLSATNPSNIIFTQAGLHEGLAYGLFPSDWRGQDRMLDWCQRLAAPWTTASSQAYLQELEKQVLLQQPMQTHWHRRLLKALCWLTLVQQAVAAGQTQSPLPLLTNATIPELSPRERVFLLIALIFYEHLQEVHRGKLEAFAKLMPHEDIARAQNLGFLLREIAELLLTMPAPYGWGHSASPAAGLPPIASPIASPIIDPADNADPAA